MSTTARTFDWLGGILLAAVIITAVVTALTGPGRAVKFIEFQPNVAIEYEQGASVRPGEAFKATYYVRRSILCPTLIYETWWHVESQSYLQSGTPEPFYSVPVEVNGNFTPLSLRIAVPSRAPEGTLERHVRMEGLDDCQNMVTDPVPVARVRVRE